MDMVESFITNYNKQIEDLFEKQMKERFQLVVRHSKTTPYGPKGWLHYKTLNTKHILTEIKAEEIINENLLTYRRHVKRRVPNSTPETPPIFNEMMDFDTIHEPIGFVREETRI